MQKHSRNPGLRLIPPQVRAEQRALTDAFLRTVAALPKRPEPHGAWDSRARGTNKSLHPATDAVMYCRSAMRSAIETGNTETIRTTRLNVEAYFAECADAACTVGLVLMDRPAVADVVQDECEAVSAIVAANESTSPGALETARQKGQRALDSIASYLRSAGAQSRQSAAVR